MKHKMRLVQGLALVILVTVVSSATKHEHNHLLCPGFVPENDLRIPVPKPGDQKLAGGVTQEEFEAAIGAVEQVYTPIFSQKGKRFRVKKLWTNEQVNAVAYVEGGYSVVEIWGGLGRHSTMTADAVTLVTCHEVGHHLGGVPKYTDQASGAWASVEGQSDYFATLKCLRKVFAPGIDNWVGEVDAPARTKCENSHGVNTRDAKVCMRIAMASISSARLSASLGGGGSPSFNNRDNSVVTRTYERHPAAQCRLDTYMNGDVCRVRDTVDVSDSNHDTGVCRNITDEEYGARSRCWYKPVASAPPPNPNPNPTPQPPPVDGIALTPRLNGLEIYSTPNPNQVLTFSWDVSGSSGARGIYFEVLGPNKEFSEPNGIMPDRAAMRGGTIAQVRGQVQILPVRQLPGWGNYKFRVIPLDATGRRAVGRFSNPAVLNLGQ